MAIKRTSTFSTTVISSPVDLSQGSTAVIQKTSSPMITPSTTSTVISEEQAEIITSPAETPTPALPPTEESDEIIATPIDSTSIVTIPSEEEDYIPPPPTSVTTIQDISLSDFADTEETALSLLKQQVQSTGTVSESQLVSIGMSYEDLQKSLDTDFKSYESALKKIKSLQSPDGSFSVVKALEKGVTPKELLILGISVSEINKAQDAANSDKLLSKYTDKKGTLDPHAAIRDGVQKRVFTSAGYDVVEIDKAFTTVSAQVKIEKHLEDNPWDSNLLGYLKSTKDFKSAEAAGYDSKQVKAFKELISKDLIGDSGEIKIEESLATRDLIPLLKSAGLSSNVIDKARVNVLAKQAVDRKGGAAGFLLAGGSVGSLVAAGFSTGYVKALESVKGYLDPKTNTVDVSSLVAEGKLTSKVNKDLITLGYKQEDIESVAEVSRLQTKRTEVLQRTGQIGLGSVADVDFNPISFYSSSVNKSVALKDLQSLGYTSEVIKSLDSLSDSKVLDKSGGFDWRKIATLSEFDKSKVISDLDSLGIKSDLSEDIIKEVKVLQELEPYIDSNGTVDISSVLRGTEGVVTDEALRYVGLSEEDIKWRQGFVKAESRPVSPEISRLALQTGRYKLDLSPTEVVGIKGYVESPEYQEALEVRLKERDPQRQLGRSLLNITPIVGTVLYTKEAAKDGFTKKELAWIGVQAMLEASMVLPVVGAIGRAGIVATPTVRGLGAPTRAAIASRNVGLITGSGLTSAVQFPILATRSVIRPIKMAVTLPWKTGEAIARTGPATITSSKWGVPVSKTLPIVAEASRLKVQRTAFGIPKTVFKRAIKAKKSVTKIPSTVSTKTKQVIVSTKTLPIVPVQAVVKTAKGISGGLDIGEAVAISSFRKAQQIPSGLKLVSGPKIAKGTGRGLKRGLRGGYGVVKEAFDIPISKFLRGYVSDYTYPIIHPIKTVKGVYRVGTGGVALGSKDIERYSAKVFQSFKTGTPYATREPVVSRVSSRLRKGFPGFKSKVSRPKRRLDVSKLRIAGGAAVDAPIRPGGFPRPIRPYTVKSIDPTTGLSIVPSTGRSITPGRFYTPEGVVEAPVRPGITPSPTPTRTIPVKPPGPGQPRRAPSTPRPRRVPETLPDSPRPSRIPSTPTPSRPSRVQPGTVPVIPVEPLPLSPFLPVKPQELEFVEPKEAVVTTISRPYEFGSLEELKTAGAGEGLRTLPLIGTQVSPFERTKIDFAVLPDTKVEAKSREEVETFTDVSTKFETKPLEETQIKPEIKPEVRTDVSVRTDLDLRTQFKTQPLVEPVSKTRVDRLISPPKIPIRPPFPWISGEDDRKTRHVTLITSVSPQGSGSVSPGTRTIIEDSIITISPESRVGWRFDHWEGDVPDGYSTRRSLSLLMEDNKRVVGVFVPGQETALVTSKIRGVDIILPTGDVTPTGIAHTRRKVPQRLTGLPGKLILGRRPIKAEASRLR